MGKPLGEIELVADFQSLSPPVKRSASLRRSFATNNYPEFNVKVWSMWSRSNSSDWGAGARRPIDDAKCERDMAVGDRGWCGTVAVRASHVLVTHLGNSGIIKR